MVTIRNYDSAPHTFTAPALGLNVIFKGGSGRRPSVTTFRFRSLKARTYTWSCLGACDRWAMTPLGFMKGRIVVSA